MANENTRVERNNTVKKAQKGKRRRRRKQTIAVSVILLLVVAIVLSTLSLTVFFNIKNIKVTGSATYSADEIIAVADLSIGDNLLRISKNKISNNLQKKLPFISSVEIKRNFPESVEIIVTETTENFCLVTSDGYFTADISGKVIAKKAERVEDLVALAVSNETVLNVGEKVQFATEREEELFFLYANLIENNNYTVNFVNISDPYNSYMKINDKIIVKLGSSTYFEEKVAYLNAGLKKISKEAKGVFDLSAWSHENNQPVFTYEDITQFDF